MKKDRKNIILQSLASMLEERNLTKITTALLAEKCYIDTSPAKELYMLSCSLFVMMLFLVSATNLKKVNYQEEIKLKMHICFL